MDLMLNEEERDLLRRALGIYISDLREEIYKTEDHQTKPPLKREEEVLKDRDVAREDLGQNRPTGVGDRDGDAALVVG